MKAIVTRSCPVLYCPSRSPNWKSKIPIDTNESINLVQILPSNVRIIHPIFRGDLINNLLETCPIGLIVHRLRLRAKSTPILQPTDPRARPKHCIVFLKRLHLSQRSPNTLFGIEIRVLREPSNRRFDADSSQFLCT
jgi:hypothetical protein